MIGTLCGGFAPPDAPDMGFCCYGSVHSGPSGCYCWEPIYDLEQQPVRQGLALPPVPLRLCPSCAYKPGSPERRGEPYAVADQELLDELVLTAEPFFCHAGMRRITEWRHPAGTVVPAPPGSYDPPIAPAGDGLRPVPYKADGSPGEFCAGWLLRCAKERARAQGADAA